VAISDFNFTKALLEKFFSSKTLQRKFDDIFEYEITDWEKWWQIELALYMARNDEIADDWDIEESFYTDKRKQKCKNTIRVDLCFRRKGFNLEKFICLELKQNKDYKVCIRNMIKDAEKVFSAHKRSHNGAEVRELFVVGIYPSRSKKEVHNFIEAEIEKSKIEIRNHWTKFIPGCNFSISMF